MKIKATTCELRGVRAVRFVAVIPKSAKLGIPKRRQKTWTLETCAPEFTKENERAAIEAEAKRWEAKVMAQITPPETASASPMPVPLALPDATSPGG